KPHHLPADGSAREATIEKATIETLHPRPTETKKFVVVSFVGKVHKLILNGGNANRLVAIAGDDLTGWSGIVISLKRGEWASKPTIIIEKATNGKENGK